MKILQLVPSRQKGSMHGHQYVRRGWGSLLVVLLTAFLALFAPRLPLAERLELRTHDLRFHARGNRPHRAKVAVVAIDDETVAAWLDRPMAFWGDRYAALIRNARAAGAQWIGLDVIPATHAEEYTQMLVGRALERARGTANVTGLTDAIIDTITAGDAGGDADGTATSDPETAPDTALRRAVSQADGHVILADSVQSPTLVLDLKDLPGISVRRRPYIGFVDMPIQGDDAVRTAFLYVRPGKTYGGAAAGVLPSLPALLADRASNAASESEGHRSGTSALDPTNAGALRQLARRVVLSTSESESGATTAAASAATFWINPTAPDVRSSLPTVPALRLADGPAGTLLTRADRDALRGAVVLIGMTGRAAGSDVYRAPGGVGGDSDRPTVPGVLLLAQAASTLLDGAALARLPWWGDGMIASVLLFVFAAMALPMRLSFVPGVTLALTLSALWWFASAQALDRYYLLLPLAVPLLTLGTGVLLYYGVASVEERGARRRVEVVFGRNVSPQVRDYLIAQDNAAAVGRVDSGAIAEASVLFFDVRGSTAFAERRDPAEVIAALNSLFEVVVPIVQQHNGLINRFMGDGFLALFGSPQPQEDHSHAAATAAIEIAQAVERWNTASNDTGRPVLRGGCGVHTGPVVYGYLGDRDRAEFTVIGDTVNLAARLEGLNKRLNSTIVLSAQTVESLDGALLSATLKGPFECAIEGRAAPAAVFTAGSVAGQPFTE